MLESSAASDNRLTDLLAIIASSQPFTHRQAEGVAP
jgi:hypothetical protein